MESKSMESKSMESLTISCFKAYDIRGRVPDQLNEDIAYRIGRAFAAYMLPANVVVGHDIRLSSRALTNALIKGLMEGGADVIDIGQCGTEEIYFATSYLQTSGGIVVTASHNPMDYNGMKLVREQSKPISGDTGLFDIKALAEAGQFPASGKHGTLSHQDTRPAYVQHLMSYFDVSALKPLKLVINAGNGGAGVVADELAARLPFEFIRVHHEADGNFPNGVPNPLLEENRKPTIDAIIRHGADLGVAWDGDFDRCFFFDETGAFVEGYYIVGLLAQSFLEREPGASIIHDPRLTWNTQDVCAKYSGKAVLCKTGHAFIKERMRLEDAVYGGEMSAHHYFRDFAYCDSGMIPWLLVCELMCRSGKSLSQLVAERMAAFPASGEINRVVDDPHTLLKMIEARYAPDSLAIDHTDGLSIEYEAWRFNIRMSNTEPVVRLNVESRADPALMKAKTEELLGLVESAH
jgi:phosphomannomutase